MNLKIKFLLYLNLFVYTLAFGQIEQYDYQRSINGINNQWHQIDLPEGMYEKVDPSFSDIRIFGITNEKDTIEAPYLLKIGKSIIEKEATPFKIINKTLTKNGHYFTFELTNPTILNQIILDIGEQNFDWKIKLEGSQNQQDWFTIKDNYRIVSINNPATDYQFTTLNFTTAKYRFFRVLVKTSRVVTLKKAQLALQNKAVADYITYPIMQQEISNNKQQKTTLIELELAHATPLSFLKIGINNNFDFYRSINIQYLKDSIQTEKGWHYQYQSLHRAVLSSLESNDYSFKSTLVKKLRIIIQNQDNPPLTIDSVVIKGYPHQLIARFTQPAIYYLTYGRKNSPSPRYDLQQFSDKIPTTLTTLSLGEEQLIPKTTTPTTSPLFANKWWLWGLMGFIILVLGWFTMKMLKET